MKPTICRNVIVRNLHGAASSDEAGIITRVHGSVDPADGQYAMVNVSVLADGSSAVVCKSSVPLFETRALADAYLRVVGPGHSPTVAHWPDREPTVRAVAMPLAA